ncbi:MAG: GNAT family N-acetyltransferase [Acidimicrobiales bacterium]
MHPFAEHLPITRIVASSGPVTLRVPDQVELAAYATELAAGGLDDDHTRATLQWQPATPALAASQTIGHVSEAFTRGPGPRWLIPLFVFVEGRPIGRQDLGATPDDPRLRTAFTASVLLNTHRGLGFGTHARACVLEVAWALGVERATTAWNTDNAASSRVSAKLGYVTNGVEWWWDPRAGREIEICRAYTTEEQFRAAWSGEVKVVGVDDDVRTWLS